MPPLRLLPHDGWNWKESQDDVRSPDAWLIEARARCRVMRLSVCWRPLWFPAGFLINIQRERRYLRLTLKSAFKEFSFRVHVELHTFLYSVYVRQQIADKLSMICWLTIKHQISEVFNDRTIGRISNLLAPALDSTSPWALFNFSLRINRFP